MEKELVDIPKLFGSNVRKYRKNANLTQEELSKKLDISQKHLSIIETGTQFASPALIAKISSELNVSPSALFGEDTTFKQINILCGMIDNIITNKIEGLYIRLKNDLYNQKNNRNSQNNFF